MTRRQKQWSVGFLVVAVIGLSVGWAVAQRDNAKPVAPEALLPGNAAIYVGYDGALQHAEAWQRTAAYEALYKSGLMDLFNKVIVAVQQ